MEAVQGCTKTVTFQTTLPCEACGMAMYNFLCHLFIFLLSFFDICSALCLGFMLASALQ